MFSFVRNKVFVNLLLLYYIIKPVYLQLDQMFKFTVVLNDFKVKLESIFGKKTVFIRMIFQLNVNMSFLMLI